MCVILLRSGINTYHLKVDILISKYTELLKKSLILISHFDTHFSFKCFLLCHHPLVFLLSFNSWGFRWLCQRCLMVNVPLYLNICGLSSSIFWYRFITRFYSGRKTGSIWFQHLETMKFLPWVLCPCICSSGSRFVLYGNLNRICIPLLCENCINLLYVESVRTAYPGLLYSSASLYIHG